ERTRRRLDSRSGVLARRFSPLRMPRRHAVELTEILDVLQRKIVSRKVQPAVKKHAAVTGGQDKTVAVDPARIVWIVPKSVAVQNRADLGRPQRKAQMAGVARVDGVDGKAAGNGRRL